MKKVEKEKEKWMMIDSPDAVDSGMEMASGSPPAEFDISVGLDVLLTAISVTTVVSEKWMERFVMDLDVFICSDGLASGDDPAKESLDVGSDVSVLPVAGCKFPAVFLGKVAVGPLCLRVDSEETLLTVIDERAQLARAAPLSTRFR